MKKCYICNTVKPFTLFGRLKSAKDGYRTQCKACRNTKANVWYQKSDKTERKEYDRLHYIENKEQKLCNNKKWKQANKALVKFYKAKRRALELQATPSYADMNTIKRIYKLATIMTLIQKKEYHVDHIIPLQGKRVCGFHIETNLQVISATSNLKKGNRY